jgi:hypothetical protein
MFNQNSNQNPELEKEQNMKKAGQGGFSGRGPEDIFAGTEKTDNASIQAKAPGGATPPNKQPFQNKAEAFDAGAGRGDGGKYAVLGAIVLVMLVLGVGGYYAYTRLFNIELPLDSEKTGDSGTGADISPSIGDLEDYERPDFVDADQDGLSDEEEMSLGLETENVDSDNDGLFDYEEVKVYKTDPLKPDTDGDGYSDGEEVKDGFNPLGEGVLYGSEERERTVKQIEPETIDKLKDSDSDGLSDWEEENIYFTDLNNPDTDGDGYLDGIEVQGGYNPKGSGAL